MFPMWLTFSQASSSNTSVLSKELSELSVLNVLFRIVRSYCANPNRSEKKRKTKFPKSEEFPINERNATRKD